MGELGDDINNSGALLDLCEREFGFLHASLCEDDAIAATDTGVELIRSVAMALLSAKRLRLELSADKAPRGFEDFDESNPPAHLSAVKAPNND